MSNMSNAPVRPSHPFNVSSVFEVSDTLAPADNRNYTFRGTTVAITCDGWQGDNSREYDGALVAYCGPMEVPHEEHCYALRAKMIPQVESAKYKLYYEAEHKIMVGTTDTFSGELNNNTGASGLGIVTSKVDIPEPNSEDTTLAFVMTHVDYSPELRESVTFEFEYRIRPTLKLKKSQSIVQCGKEILVHGFIVDWDDTSNRWIVTALNVCTGPETVSKKRAIQGAKVTPTGRVRPAKHVAPRTPTKTTPTSITNATTQKVSARSSPRLDSSSQLAETPDAIINELYPEAGPSTSRPSSSSRPAKKTKTN
ncbi:uncharacterized protein MELLADRAFT_53503 [Melampsora larici-populina 98AG31]|uniref:Uncharacterized protein n=1 Tax=Melampsora larici-populina (strain 98AG31 / pathotype 3-4-7) TaxID=747676 RepID=F4S0A0_MELLP|nr:uncharacterized protein MELLADRAFT_53503 [Melampsora larici-populina 98AG31]EGG01926.1 hypothetical protein MELLADRAFT_53503 [Melampsora larici-populina 98AG31]